VELAVARVRLHEQAKLIGTWDHRTEQPQRKLEGQDREGAANHQQQRRRQQPGGRTAMGASLMWVWAR